MAAENDAAIDFGTLQGWDRHVMRAPEEKRAGRRGKPNPFWMTRELELLVGALIDGQECPSYFAAIVFRGR